MRLCSEIRYSVSGAERISLKGKASENPPREEMESSQH